MYDPNTTDAELLIKVLAVRNEKCPTCGYNLRDGLSQRCPECGRKLRVGIHEDSPLWRRRSLLVLIFAALFMSSSARSARAWNDLNKTRTSSSITVLSQMLTPAPLPMAPVFVIDADTGQVDVEPTTEAGLVDVDDDAAGETTVDIQIIDGAQVIGGAKGGAITRSLGTAQDPVVEIETMTTAASDTPLTTVRFRQTVVAPGWSGVTFGHWSAAVGWSVMIVVAIVGLSLLWRYRRRPAPERVSTLLHVIAWVVAVAYCATEVLIAARAW